MMSQLRQEPLVLAEWSSVIANSTGIPVEHVVKDFWITESLRVMASTASENRVHLVFRGGTSLSKGYQIISRFSEDIDLLCLAEGGGNAVHSAMRRLHESVAGQLGVEPLVDTDKSMTGEFRPAEYVYPGQALLEGEAPGRIRVELSTWGGSIPSEVRTLRSLIAEHADAAGLEGAYEESEAFEIMVLRPERTLVEKLAILHDAASATDERRQRKTARHYYDIWCLLGRAELRSALAGHGTLALANEVYKHNTATKSRAAQKRPPGGFAASRAFSSGGPAASRDEYSRRVVGRLIWPGHPQPTFDECLARVQEYAAIL